MYFEDTRDIVGPVSIQILVVPSKGSGPDSRGVIVGKIIGIENPLQYRITIYAFTDLWYIQPTHDQPLTMINSDGTWESTTHLGSQYAVLLVKSSFKPLSTIVTLPSGDDVLAFKIIGAKISP